ncbi:MAG: MFS transporter [Chloroflexota bacterium]|nr:MFS transporter [Chloroflexota bacterium]
MFFSGPAQTYGVSAFVDPMLADLGWSRSLFSTAYSVGTLASAGALLIVGRQIDRWGNRAVLTVSAIGFGGALFLMSAVGGAVTLLVGFALLRTCGSGVLTLAARTLVPHWFVRRRGRAFSLLGLAGALSLAVVPPVNELLIRLVGWRTAWRIDAIVIWLVLLPAVAIVVRNRPEDIGQRPDGERPPAGQDAVTSEPDAGLTLREALRTPAFWGLIGASVVPSLVVTGLAFNQVAIFTARGLPSTLAATTFTVESALGLPMTLLAGWLVDRYPVRYVLAAGQICLAAAMVSLLATQSPALALLYSAWRGASSGLWMVAADVAWPAYFGRRHLGSIRGFGFSVGVVGAAIGPIPFGLAYDLLGGYNPAIAGLLILPVVATFAVLRSRPPLIVAPGHAVAPASVVSR